LPEFATRALCTGENPDQIMFYSQTAKEMQISMKDWDGKIREKIMHRLS